VTPARRRAVPATADPARIILGPGIPSPGAAAAPPVRAAAPGSPAEPAGADRAVLAPAAAPSVPADAGHPDRPAPAPGAPAPPDTTGTDAAPAVAPVAAAAVAPVAAAAVAPVASAAVAPVASAAVAPVASAAVAPVASADLPGSPPTAVVVAAAAVPGSAATTERPKRSPVVARGAVLRGAVAAERLIAIPPPPPRGKARDRRHAHRVPSARSRTARTRSDRTLVRFAVVGAVGVAINTAILVLLHQRLAVPLVPASVAATEIAILANYLGNELWTFPVRRLALGRLARFQLTALGSLAVTAASLWVLAEAADLPLLLANLGAIALGSGWNFAGNVLWTWKGAA